MPKVTEFVKFALQPELRCCRDRQCRHDRGAEQRFLEAGMALMAALDRYERGRDPARFLNGEKGGVAERWA